MVPLIGADFLHQAVVELGIFINALLGRRKWIKQSIRTVTEKFYKELMLSERLI